MLIEEVIWRVIQVVIKVLQLATALLDDCFQMWPIDWAFRLKVCILFLPLVPISDKSLWWHHIIKLNRNCCIALWMKCEKLYLHCYGGLLGFCSHRIKLAQRAKAQWRAKERERASCFKCTKSMQDWGKCLLILLAIRWVRGLSSLSSKCSLAWK